MPAAALADQRVRLTDLWGADAAPLPARLARRSARASASCTAAAGRRPATGPRCWSECCASAGPSNWPDRALAAAAAGAGYADQAHLTRECRRLSGRAPSDLFKTARSNRG